MRFDMMHKGLVLILLPVLFSIGFIVYMSLTLQQAEKQIEHQIQSARVLQSVGICMNASTDVSLGFFLYVVTRNAYWEKIYRTALAQHDNEMKKLEVLYAEQPRELAAVRRIKRISNAYLALHNLILRLPQGQALLESSLGLNSGEPTELPADVNKLLDMKNKKQLSPQTLYTELARNARSIDLQSAAARNQDWLRIQLSLTIAVITNLGLTLLLGLLFNNNVKNRLQRVKHNIEQLRNRKTLLPPMPGSDEISDLDLAVRQSAQQLGELELYHNKVIAVIGSELHLPLVAIKETIALLGASDLSPKAVRLSNIASGSMDRLIRMVDELIGIDTVQGNAFGMSCARTSADEVISQAVQAVQQAASRRSIKIETSAASGSAWGDSDRLIQVLVNLLSNAIKFSPDNSVITILTSETEQHLHISVVDRGRGIPDEFQQRIFSRFAQVYQSDEGEIGETGRKGFGLGLSICKQIMEQQHGTISLQSKLNEGSTFTMICPLTKPSQRRVALVGTTAQNARRNFSTWLNKDALLWQKGSILIGLPMVCQIMMLCVLCGLLAQADTHIEASQQSYRFSATASQFWLSQQEMAEAALSYRVFRDEASKQRYSACSKALTEQCKQLRADATGREDDLALEIDRIRADGQQILDHLIATKPPKSLAEIVSSEDARKLTTLRDSSDRLMDLIQTSAHNRLRSFLPIEVKRNLMMALWVALCANVALAFLLLVFLKVSITGRIDKIVRNTTLLRERRELLPPETGQDEICEIDRAFYSAGQNLAAVEDFKNELVSVVGHDIRTPLSSVQLVLQMAESGAFGEINPALLTKVQEAEKESTRLFRLINDLLEAEKKKFGSTRLDQLSTVGDASS